MQLSFRARVAIGVALCLVACSTLAEPKFVTLVGDIESELASGFGNDDVILDAAKKLFASLATISLVWTMGLHVVRQDLGEALMEMLRFMVVTGTLYWLLVNASEHQGGDGFVERIVGSFYQLTNGDSTGANIRSYGNGAVNRALNVYLTVIGDTTGGDNADRIVGGLIGIMVLAALTVLAAQFLLALILAWFLGYGGIFLLGFGGARWTSQIAINYYKHVVALGVAILALGIIGMVSENIFRTFIPTYGLRTSITYPALGKILAVSLLMLVLGLRVPQLLYTLVTGSSIGMFAGTAGMVGSAIAASGGGLAPASGRFSNDGGAHSPSGTGSAMRSSSAMAAIERSAVAASSMADPFHVSGGSDAFGAPRRADPDRGFTGGSVFGTPGPSSSEHAASFGELVPETGHRRSHTSVATSGHPSTRTAYTSAASTSTDPVLSVATEDGDRPDYQAEMTAIAARRFDDLSSMSVTRHHGESAGKGLNAGAVSSAALDGTPTVFESNAMAIELPTGSPVPVAEQNLRDVAVVTAGQSDIDDESRADGSTSKIVTGVAPNDGTTMSAVNLQHAGMESGVRMDAASHDDRVSSPIRVDGDDHGRTAGVELVVDAPRGTGALVGARSDVVESLASSSAGIADESAPTGVAAEVVAEAEPLATVMPDSPAEPFA